MKKTLMIALLAGAVTAQVQAQSTPPAAPAPAAAPSAAKAALLARLVALQVPALEFAARNMGEGPLRQLMSVAQQHIGNVPEDKRQAAIAQIDGLGRKYADDLIPTAKDAAAKVAPAVYTQAFDKAFTEEELRQLLAALESPVYKKYTGVQPEVSAAVSEKLVAEMRPTVDPRVKALEQNVIAALGLDQNGAPATAPKKPAAKPKK